MFVVMRRENSDFFPHQEGAEAAALQAAAQAPGAVFDILRVVNSAHAPKAEPKLHAPTEPAYPKIPEGFILTGGSKPELSDDFPVMVMLRSGAFGSGTVGDGRWDLTGKQSDVIAYIPLRPAAEAEAKPDQVPAPSPKFKPGDRVYFESNGNKFFGTVVEHSEHRIGADIIGRNVADPPVFARFDYDSPEVGWIPESEAFAAEDADGWMKWEGGPCPVEGTTPVFVKLRDGTKYDIPLPAKSLFWGRARPSEAGKDILEYRRA